MTILDQILAGKRLEVAERKRARPIEELAARVRQAPGARGFIRALAAGSGPRIIAEVKKASPSKGVIREDFDPVLIAMGYERAGAAAVSVLTDEKHFQGRLEFLEGIRAAIDLPLLRKDFIIDPYQVQEARAAGADAILLILAAVPGDREIAALAEEAAALGMDVLWEVHDEGEMRRLAPLRPALVGINNRDLRTFEVTLETTRRLLPLLPEGAMAVSESGFSSRGEIEMMEAWGVRAFLIGESLLRAPEPEDALAALLGRPAASREGEARR